MHRFMSKDSSDHYVRFCHDALSHLVIDASNDTWTDFERHFSCFVFYCRQFGNIYLPRFGVKHVTINRICRSILSFG